MAAQQVTDLVADIKVQLNGDPNNITKQGKLLLLDRLVHRLETAEADLERFTRPAQGQEDKLDDPKHVAHTRRLEAAVTDAFAAIVQLSVTSAPTSASPHSPAAAPLQQTALDKLDITPALIPRNWAENPNFDAQQYLDHLERLLRIQQTEPQIKHLSTWTSQTPQHMEALASIQGQTWATAVSTLLAMFTSPRQPEQATKALSTLQWTTGTIQEHNAKFSRLLTANGLDACRYTYLLYITSLPDTVKSIIYSNASLIPNRDTVTPARLKALMDHVAQCALAPSAPTTPTAFAAAVSAQPPAPRPQRPYSSV